LPKLSAADIHSRSFLELQAKVAQAVSGISGLSVVAGSNRETDDPLSSLTDIRTVMRSEHAPEKAQAHVRGQVDLAALALRYHNQRQHAAARPTEPKAANIFDALETIRLEAVGGESMAGVRSNIAARHEAHCELQGYARYSDEADEPPLADIVAMLAREALTGEAPPQPIEKLVALWRPLLEKKLAASLPAMRRALHQQAAFAAATRQFLTDMDLLESAPAQPSQPDADSDTDHQDAQGQRDDTPYESHEDSDGMEPLPSDETIASDDVDGQRMQRADEIDDGNEQQELEGAMTPEYGHNQADQFAEHASRYHAYSVAHDEIIAAEALASHEELQRLHEKLQENIQKYHTISSRLAARLQRLLMAQQTRQWIYEQEDGMIDNARLARIVARPDMTDIYKREQESNFRDTVVTLLIDNSGSMRGRPITVAATCADILARTLERCGVKVEVLGFTTRAWKGGQSREAWLNAGKPAMPGRLNDLRHIIYKAADEPWRRAKRNLGLMMREGLLKENIDGEALEWAHSRLLARPEQRRILMVISDGAPVDDSHLIRQCGRLPGYAFT
jgi:cobaltochelatase CobT